MSETALGSLLRQARNKAGMSQRDVESDTGISNAYLSQLESGKVKEPSPRILHTLSEAYGIEYADLLVAAGYPLPTIGRRRQAAFRSSKRFGPITADEETALKDYLDFLRSKERKRKR